MIASMGTEAMIRSNCCGKVAIPHATAICEYGHRIGRCFNKLKHFRRFATRYGRRTIDLTRFLHHAAATIRLR